MHTDARADLEARLAVPLRALPDAPLVSVLMASYNYGRYLPAALDSLLAQTYDGWEAVVCDDGSTDDSAEIARAVADRDPRVRVLAQANQGAGVALSTAFAASRGEIVAMLDADDTFSPGKLAWLVQTFRQRPKVGFVSHGVEAIDGEGRPSGATEGLARADGWIAEEVLRYGGIFRGAPSSGLAVRREVAERLFPLPAELRRYQDMPFLRVAPLMTRTYATPEVHAQFRKHDANLSGHERLALRTLRVHDEAGVVTGRMQVAWLAECGIDPVPEAWRYEATFDHLLARQQVAYDAGRVGEAFTLARRAMATRAYREMSAAEKVRNALVLATPLRIRNAVPTSLRVWRYRHEEVRVGSEAADEGVRASGVRRDG